VSSVRLVAGMGRRADRLWNLSTDKRGVACLVSCDGVAAHCIAVRADWHAQWCCTDLTPAGTMRYGNTTSARSDTGRAAAGVIMVFAAVRAAAERAYERTLPGSGYSCNTVPASALMVRRGPYKPQQDYLMLPRCYADGFNNRVRRQRRTTVLARNAESCYLSTQMAGCCGPLTLRGSRHTLCWLH
jgi:hypothetical protein